jgi:putative sterol carrier protein
LNTIEEYSPQVFIEITLRVICNSLYPSLELWDEYEIWVKFIEEPLHKMKALAIGHLKDVGEHGTQDIKLIGYIKRIFQSVMPELRYLKPNEKVELFVTFS